MKCESRHIPKTPLELLAPAGSFLACKAAVHAGADAVYLGGSRFGARAYADNFTQEQLLEAIDYAHLHGCKVYMTVNTLLKQPEIDALYEYLLPFYEHGLDAAIVQDFGVLELLHACFEDLPIHASTQMSIVSAYGASYLKKLGVRRIVTARELSLEEVHDIHSQTGIEIESFIHGALCYSYSGQCLFSSMLGGRSGNRGRCAQPCRLPYTVLDEKKHMLSKPDGYPLSLKDLCTAHIISELAKAGVYSFKIEGRMKTPEYTAGVVSVYRRILDQYLHIGEVLVHKKDEQMLLDTGNRSGFTQGYYKERNGRDMVTYERPSHTKDKDALLKSVQKQYVDKEQKLPVYAKAQFQIGRPAQLQMFYGKLCASCAYGIVERAQKQPLRRETIIGQLSKTGNTPFVIQGIEVVMDGPVFMPKQSLNELRREAARNLEALLLTPYRRTVKETAADGRITALSVKTADAAQKNKKALFYAGVEENGQLEAVLACGFITRVYLDSTLYTKESFIDTLKSHVRHAHAAGKEVYFMLPAIFRMETAQFYKEHWQAMEQTGIDGYLAQSYDGLGFLDRQQAYKHRCVLGQSLYTYSNTAKSAYAACGWKYDTIPFELNKKEILARCNQTSELVIYGHIPLMASAQCIQKTIGQCKKKPGLCYLKDRYAKEFPVKNNCTDCYNIIYNSQPLSLIQLADELPRLHAAAYRLHFTIETKEQAVRILNCCAQAFTGQAKPDMGAVIGAYTNGHYKRGVE